MTDTIAAGATFVSAQASQGSFTQNGSNITFNVGTLLPGQVAFLSDIVTPTATGTISNVATITANEADPQPANNTAKATVTVQPTVADLGIGGSAFPNPVLVGQHVTLTIPVANGGPDPASAVTATITLPAGLALFTASATQGTTSHKGDTITAALGALDPGAVATITVDAIAVQDGTFTVQSSVAGAPDQNDPFALNNRSIIPVTASTDTTPPIITSDTLIVHNATIQGIALTFSKPLDPATAQDLRNYSLRTAGRDNIFGTPDDVNVPLASAVYGPQSLTVMLTPRQHLKVGFLYQLMVNGPGSPGITDLAGNVLDGDKNGIADGVFVDYLSRGSHLRPMNNPELLNLPKFHAGRPVPHPPAPKFPSRQVQTTLNFTRNLIQG